MTGRRSHIGGNQPRNARTARARQRDFARWPKYRDGYLRAFGKMLEARRAAGLATEWETPDEVMHWWLQDGYDPNQLEIEWEEQL